MTNPIRLPGRGDATRERGSIDRESGEWIAAPAAIALRTAGNASGDASDGVDGASSDRSWRPRQHRDGTARRGSDLPAGDPLAGERWIRENRPARLARGTGRHGGTSAPMDSILAALAAATPVCDRQARQDGE